MENNIYEPPTSELEVQSLGELDLASRWARLGAALIDGVLSLIITLPLMYVTGGFDKILSGEEPSLMYSLIMLFVGTVVFVLLHGYFLTRDGQTIGKKVLSIKIVTLDNQLPKIPHFLKRYGFMWLLYGVPLVGPILNLVNLLFIFSKTKRCLHDHVGGTKVVVAE